jgi:hypothetical protein
MLYLTPLTMRMPTPPPTHPWPPPPPPRSQVVMQAYEADVKKPIRGLLQGELARTLLIQVSAHGEHGPTGSIWCRITYTA